MYDWFMRVNEVELVSYVGGLKTSFSCHLLFNAHPASWVLKDGAALGVLKKKKKKSDMLARLFSFLFPRTSASPPPPPG